MSQTTQNIGFDALGIPSGILQRLAGLGFVSPTPIQEQAIPIALERHDVIGIAQTGTGKTLAFGIPMIANLETYQMGLVLAPTRELALQIDETLTKLRVKTAVLIGGQSFGRQVKMIRNKPNVIIATPGRLQDHLEQGTISLRNVGVAVLDEADRMLDMGFAPAIRRILDNTPRERQTMLFSATMPKQIVELAQRYLNKPHRIEISVAGTPCENVEQELYVVKKEERQDLLLDILDAHEGSTLVFSRTRHGAAKLAKAMRYNGHTSAEIHSDRTLAQRVAALQGFKDGQFRILVATDIAARGIDVKDIALVVNFDVPEHAEDYVHRIGRTGRAGAQGKAITLVAPEQAREVRDIEKLINAELPLAYDSPMELPKRKVATPTQGSGKNKRNKKRGSFKKGNSSPNTVHRVK